MKTYFYTVKNSSTRRGYNQTVTVYRVVKNIPVMIGYNDQIDTASTYGEYGEAVRILDFHGIEKAKDSYSLKSDKVRLLSLGSLWDRNTGESFNHIANKVER